MQAPMAVMEATTIAPIDIGSAIYIIRKFYFRYKVYMLSDNLVKQLAGIQRRHAVHLRKGGAETGGAMAGAMAGAQTGGALRRRVGGAQTGGKGTRVGARKNKWVEHVKKFAAEHGITYAKALKHPRIREGYSAARKTGGAQTGGKGTKKGAEKNRWIEHVKIFAGDHGITYAKALKHPRIREGYPEDVEDVIFEKPKRAPRRKTGGAETGGVKPKRAPRRAKTGGSLLDIIKMPLRLLGLGEGEVEVGGAKRRKVGGAACGGKGTKKGASVNPWVSHVKAFAAKHRMTYPQALKDPRCKASYRK